MSAVIALHITRVYVVVCYDTVSVISTLVQENYCRPMLKYVLVGSPTRTFFILSFLLLSIVIRIISSNFVVSWDI